MFCCSFTLVLYANLVFPQAGLHCVYLAKVRPYYQSWLFSHRTLHLEILTGAGRKSLV